MESLFRHLFLNLYYLFRIYCWWNRNWLMTFNSWGRKKYVAILKPFLKTKGLVTNGSSKWTMKHNSKFWQNGLRTTKLRSWSGHHRVHIWPRKWVGKTEKSMCKQGGLQTWLSYRVLSGAAGQNSMDYLWEACGVPPQYWPKLNNKKGMLPNSN